MRGKAEWDEQTSQQQETVAVLLTRSTSHLVGLLRSLSRLRGGRFRRYGLRDGRPWRKGVLSLKHRRRNETKEYHRAYQSPHENDWLPRNENAHGTPPGTKSAVCDVTLLYCEAPKLISQKSLLFVMSETLSA
jgi:hypothetical protein